MKVTPPGGSAFDLGTTEATPRIGITDYSRRVTDAFGVTTIVPRGFSRTMSVRLGVPTDRVNEVSRTLTALRAKAALWEADPRFAWLNLTGYFKDLSFGLPVGDLSYCTLTVDGLAETTAVTDNGVDPTTNNRPSTLRFVHPAAITDATLTSSTVAEADAPAWSAGATYALGANVIRGHRLYESLAAGNIGADPETTPAKWTSSGPTNRWAMFDDALGTATTASTAVEVVLTSTTAVSAVALLDTNAASVRVRVGGYDRTVVPDEAGKALFLDLAAPAGSAITVTITPASVNPRPRHWADTARWRDNAVWQDDLAAGDGTMSIGTFLMGELRGLGVTEADPTAGITDFSLKETDDFGEVTVVERAWAKNMAVNARIRTDAVDVVASRIAAVRAEPVLWIGDDERDSLVIFGFFRDFSIEISPNVSRLSLSVEGLSKAAPIAPDAPSSIDWPDIGDPDGTKPADGADVTGENTSKDTAAVGGLGSAELLARLAAAKARADTLETVTIPAINQAMTEADDRIATARGRADSALSRADAAFDEIANEAGRLDLRIDTVSASGGYDDTDVRAKITDARGIAVGARDAVALLETEIESSVADLDTKYDAAIRVTAKTAADDTKAVSDRLEEYIAEGGGTGGGEGVDTYARSEIIKTNKAFADADTALTQQINSAVSDYTGKNTATNTRITNEVKTLADADVAFGERALRLEAQMRGDDASGLRSRISSVETATTDGRFATAQRASDLETSIGQVKGRLGTVETATTDGRFAAAQRVGDLEAYAGGVGAKVSEHVAAIAGLQGRTAAYVRYIVSAGNNRAQLTLSADANGGAGVDLVGDLTLHGNLIIPRSVGTIQIGDNAVTIGGGSTASGPVVLYYDGDGPWPLLNTYTISLPYGGTMIAFASAYVGHPDSDVGSIASTMDITAKQISGGTGFLRAGRKSEYSANGSMREVNGQVSLPAGTWQIDVRAITGFGAPSYADERKLFVLAAMR